MDSWRVAVLRQRSMGGGQRFGGIGSRPEMASLPLFPSFPPMQDKKAERGGGGGGVVSQSPLFIGDRSLVAQVCLFVY